MHHAYRVLFCILVLKSLWAAEPSWLSAKPGVELYVANTGQDSATGRAEHPAGNVGPFATLERARDEIRTLKAAGLPSGGVTVWVQAGIYELAKPIEFDERDAGSVGSPIIWRGSAGVVRLAASRAVLGLTPVTDKLLLARLSPIARGKVLQADLTSLGITDFGRMGGGFSLDGLPGLEVFADDVPLHPSRYPNMGFMTIADVLGGTTLEIGDLKGSKEGILRLADGRVDRWADEHDAYLHGYWSWDWADQRQRIVSINPDHGITLEQPWHEFGYRIKQYCYAFHLFSEIDEAGEWYLDRSSGMLYVWPPTGAKHLTVSVLPTVIQARDLAYTAFRGFTIEGARMTGVTLTRSSECAVIACTVRNHGSWGVRVEAGEHVSIMGCDISGTGDGGVSLDGGDRKKLMPSVHLAENNHIHHYARWNRVYRPGIALNGVGNQTRRNLIDHAPHQAISFAGNDHLIDGNEIHNVCEESNDAGVIYAWNDWAGRGNRISNNYIHNVYGFQGNGCMGIYLDDHFSSAVITGNLMVEVDRALWLGGGRDHVVEGNCFVNCTPAIGIDARGLTWQTEGKDELVKKLKAIPYTQEPWRSRYPILLTLLADEPMAPKGVVVRRNIGWGGLFNGVDEEAKPYVAMSDNLVDINPGFMNAANNDYRLNPASPAFKLGFQALHLEQMGLYKDSLRASWPVVHPVERLDRTSREVKQAGQTTK